MRQLWAPWRMDYILKGKERGCIFCQKLLQDKDEENLILFKSRYAFVMLNKFPYNNGHLMVVPKRHCIDIEKLEDKEWREIAYLLKLSTLVLRKCLHPHGFNIGMNIGKVGGAGEAHIHFHIVPRWVGDTNFMPVLGETKVVPEYLQNTYKNLHKAFLDFPKKKGKKGR